MCFGIISAQVVVEPEIQTDSIDIFENQEKVSDKSSSIAMLGNVLIPGLGHQYMGKSARALTYFTTEAAFIFGLAFTEGYSRRLFKDSRAYAGMYAEATGGDGADEFYWKNVGSEMSSEDYNEKMNRYRTPEEKFMGENLHWKWEDKSYQEKYNQIREKATLMHVGSSFFLAAMVLNRAISFIDIRRSLRFKGVTKQALSFQPHHNIADGESGISIHGTF